MKPINFVLIAYFLGLPLIGIAIFPHFRLLISIPLFFMAAVMFALPLMYWFMKTEGWLDIIRNMRSSELRQQMGLNALELFAPKKAEKIKKEMKQ
jgi:hypothetical protein